MTSQDLDMFELPPRYRELQDEARTLAVSIRDVVERADESGSVDPDVRERLRASGLTTVTVPEEYGGRFPAVDSLAVTVIREQLARESAHLDSLFAMQGIGSYAISVAGSDPVRKRWLPAVGTLDAIAALALTEPDVGSDLKSITTTIERDGDELVITGRKSFITNAGDAAFYCILGREDEGYSLVVVPADNAGLRIEHPHQIIAPHILGDVVLTGARVPTDHRIGEPGAGFSLALATLATFRVSVAGAAVGLAEAALDEAVRHTAGRTQFGQPLARIGAVPGRARRVLDRHRDGPRPDLSRRRSRHSRRPRLAALVLLGQGRRDRGGRPGRRSLCPGHGPVRAGAR